MGYCSSTICLVGIAWSIPKIIMSAQTLMQCRHNGPAMYLLGQCTSQPRTWHQYHLLSATLTWLLAVCRSPLALQPATRGICLEGCWDYFFPTLPLHGQQAVLGVNGVAGCTCTLGITPKPGYPVQAPDVSPAAAEEGRGRWRRRERLFCIPS